ncbi:unnamed protein product [Paramecium primaurelia]|uniref:Uncharacterized protein n=1 Tax=Paramecium primaurelia TaxID=5886 RepID=A0A8S1M9G5_PARPR|nr:unnamed protein product [Paramecium primaurelia]
MKKESKYYLGSLLAPYYYESNSYIELAPNDKAFLCPQMIDFSNPICSLKNENISTYIVTKTMNFKQSTLVLKQKKIGKQIHYKPLQIHGRISHCYDEIWWFLLTIDYVKVIARQVNFKYPDNLRQIRLDVYLKQNALNDQFDISKFNQKAFQDGFVNRERFSYAESEEDLNVDLQYFARLSLLLLFDLLNLQRTIPAMIKSDKYVKIFFTQLEKFHSLQMGQPLRLDLTFKDFARVIITNNEYYKKSLQNSAFSNKLYSLKDFKSSCLFLSKNKYYTNEETQFTPIQQEVPIYQNVYFKKYMNTLLLEIQKFISTSTKHVPEHKQKNYQKYCFELLFLKLNCTYQSLCQGFHNHQPSIDKLNELRYKVDNIEQLSIKTFLSLNAENSSLYKEIQNPFIQVIVGGINHKKDKEYFELQISSGNLCDCQKYQQSLKQLEITRREQVQKMIDYCTGKLKESEEINEINSFLNSKDQEIYEHSKPKTMVCELKQHQKQALTWMLWREGIISNPKNQEAKDKGQWQLSPLWEEVLLENGKKLYMNTFTGKITDEFQSYNSTKGGILADEMGLGKTIMTLALILQTQKKGRVTLIIVPKSVLLQWQAEIKKHSQPNSLQVLIFYKMSSRNKKIDFSNYDVILTTYTVLAQNYSNWLKENGLEDTEIYQKVRNRPDNEYKEQKEYKEYKDLKDLKESKISNDTQILNDSFEIELDSQDFCQNYDQSEEFKSIFDLKSSKSEKSKFFGESKEISLNNNECSTKTKKNNQGKVPNLFDFNYYRVILDEAHNIKTKNTLQTRSAMALKSECRWCLTGTPIQNKHDDLFSLLSFLRVETFGEYYWWNAYINKEENEEEQQCILGEIIKPIILRRTKQQLNNQNQLQINESICWVKLENKERALYDKFFEGTQQLFKVYLNSEKSRQFVHIFQIINKLRMTCDHPSIALKGINLDTNSIDEIKYCIENFFAKQKSNDQDISDKQRQSLIDLIQRGNLNDCTLCSEDGITTFDISICGHVYCHNCFKEVIETLGECPTCSKRLTLKDIMSVQSNSIEVQEIKQTKWGPSSKMLAVVNETKKVQIKREKCLIFTQWIEMIRLLEEKFLEEEIWCQVVTGAMSVEQRNKVIQSFEQHPAFTALILSLRATSTGLNLTMANHVFLVDPWWNPAIEDQAIGRADRIGQKKQVNVIRFLCANTIEEKINLLHQKKKKMIRKVIANDQKKSQDIDDFKFLIFEQPNMI